MATPRIFQGPLIPSKKMNRRLMYSAILGGCAFIISSFVISLYAFQGVQSQQSFMCSLIGQSIVQQKASLQARAKSLQVFADHDSDAFIRAYETKQAAVARKQAANFLDPNQIATALGGRCASDIDKANQLVHKK